MITAVVTADQRGSRTRADRLPEVLDGLGGLTGSQMLRGFERTAGDEFQGVLRSPVALTAVIEHLLRDGGWHVGIGVGTVEEPLPASTRAGRGEAFLRARDAVTAAKSSPARLRVVGEQPWARRLESTLWLWAALLARRTANGWAVADLVDAGLSYGEAARRLGVSPGAISQRAQTAGIAESRRARSLATDLAAELLDGSS